MYVELRSLNGLLKGRIVSHVLLEIIVQHGFRFMTCNYFTLVLWLLEYVYVSGSRMYVFVCLHHVCICMFILGQDSQSKQGGYSMHQLQGNKEFGSEKRGYLLKKSDG